MLRSIVAVLVASVVTFVWGWVSWGILPWHQPKPFENEAAVVEVIKANTSEHAFYGYPDWSEMQSSDEGASFLKKRSEGPSIYAMVRPGPKEGATMTTEMLSGFFINILASTALLLLIQKSAHTEFLDRVSIALLAGLFLAIVSALYPWNWLEAPGLHTIGALADGIIPWTLAGIVMALILPKRKPA
jgi:hypothetical protein